MAYGANSERALSTGLAIQWDLEEGYPHLRWAVTKHAKPRRPTWVRWARNGEGVKAGVTVYRAAKNGAWSFYSVILSKIGMLFRLFL
jgi:hypothetical protein